MWQTIFKSFREDPRDVRTAPLHGDGKWFFVYTEADHLYVIGSRAHQPSCCISGRRKLNEKECDVLLEFYHRRKAGQMISQEAGAKTQNQVYWYGIFAALGL